MKIKIMLVDNEEEYVWTIAEGLEVLWAGLIRCFAHQQTGVGNKAEGCCKLFI